MAIDEGLDPEYGHLSFVEAFVKASCKAEALTRENKRLAVENERLSATVQTSEGTHVHIRYDDGGAYEVPCGCLCGEPA